MPRMIAHRAAQYRSTKCRRRHRPSGLFWAIALLPIAFGNNWSLHPSKLAGNVQTFEQGLTCIIRHMHLTQPHHQQKTLEVPLLGFGPSLYFNVYTMNKLGITILLPMLILLIWSQTDCSWDDCSASAVVILSSPQKRLAMMLAD